MSTDSIKIDAIRKAIWADQWAMTHHARRRAGKRHIADEVLVQALAQGEMLEDYPYDPRGPSALVLGYAKDNRPLHAVCAFDPDGTLLIITVYEPEPPKWINERTRSPKEG